MEFLIRIRRTAFLVLCSLFPSASASLYNKEGDGSRGTDGFLKKFFPGVFPLAAPFLLYRLKKTGFSGCRVTVTDGGLLVTASR
jgi:hypothetical protein